MSIEQRTWETVDAYLFGTLEETERTGFEQELQSDSRLKEHFDFVLQFQELSRKQSNSQLKEFFKERESQKTKNIPLAGTKWKQILAVAASLLLGFYAIQFLIPLNEEDALKSLYTEYFSTYPNEINIIERGDSAANILDKTFRAYESGNFEEASSNLQDLIAEDPDNKLLVLYQANCLMALGKNFEAAEMLEQLKASGLAQYENQISWYDALNSLSIGEKDKAISELQNIINSGQDFRKTSARTILETISK